MSLSAPRSPAPPHTRREPARPPRRRPVLLGRISICGLALIAAACSGETATPIDPANPPLPADLTDVTHTLEPTDQMKQVARQQCLDDVDLEEGYVKAVSPDGGAVLAEFSVDCAEVRSGG